MTVNPARHVPFWPQTPPPFTKPERRKRLPPITAAAAPQTGKLRIRPAVEQRRHRKPGRNDPCPCGSGLKAKRCCER